MDNDELIVINKIDTINEEEAANLALKNCDQLINFIWEQNKKIGDLKLFLEKIIDRHKNCEKDINNLEVGLKHGKKNIYTFQIILNCTFYLNIYLLL